MIPEGFEKTPRLSIPRFDGGFSHIHYKIGDPTISVVEGALIEWTSHFQKMMDAGNLKGK